LADIFKNKFQKPLTPTLSQQSPVKAAENKRPAAKVQPVLRSPVKHAYKTRSITNMQKQPSNVIEFENASQRLRVVTPAARSAAHLRVSAGERKISPMNLPEYFLDIGSANNVISELAMPMACAVLHPEMGKAMEYMDLMKIPSLKPLWQRGFGNECGRRFQGIRDITGTNTCFFVELQHIPKNRNITYGKIVCYYKPHKKENERVRITVGGNRMEYSGEVATSTADLTTFKVLINSTVFTKDADMMMMDIKHY
jgi:hypothetical protein